VASVCTCLFGILAQSGDSAQAGLNAEETLTYAASRGSWFLSSIVCFTRCILLIERFSDAHHAYSSPLWSRRVSGPNSRTYVNSVTDRSRSHISYSPFDGLRNMVPVSSWKTGLSDHSNRRHFPWIVHDTNYKHAIYLHLSEILYSTVRSTKERVIKIQVFRRYI
jgi:hypothetical protein